MFAQRLLLTLGLLIYSQGILAQAVIQKDLRFPVQAEELLKGDIHVAVEIMRPGKVSIKYPELYEMDTLGFTQEKEVVIMVGKSAQIVKKPVGFFDNQNVTNQKFIQHILGEQKVRKTKDNQFKVTIPGGTHYTLKTFFDSDDISTLPNSRVIRALTHAKKMDVISQGASASLVREMSEFDSSVVGSVLVSSFIPLKEERTLMLTYTLTAYRLPVTSKKTIKTNFVNEAVNLKLLIDSFR